MNLRHVLSISLAASLLALAGCDLQAGFDYQGDPLATLKGQVTVSGDASSVPAAEVALVWSNDDYRLATSTPVSGEFPASFTMPIYTPPPDDAPMVLDKEHGDEVGIAYIMAFKEGTATGRLTESQVEDRYLGMSDDYMIIYVVHEIAQGSRAEAILGGRPSPGYHLMQVVRKTQAEKDAIAACYAPYRDAIDACDAQCDGGADPSVFDACLDACDTQNPVPDCGRAKDSLREAPDGFATSITVRLGQPVQGIDIN